MFFSLIVSSVTLAFYQLKFSQQTTPFLLSGLLEAPFQIEHALVVEVTQDVQQTLLGHGIPDGDVDRSDAEQQGQQLGLSKTKGDSDYSWDYLSTSLLHLPILELHLVPAVAEVGLDVNVQLLAVGLEQVVVQIQQTWTVLAPDLGRNR